MKISMFRFYKTSIITALVYGMIVLIGSIILSCYYATHIFLIIGLAFALLAAVFPIKIYHRNLTHVLLEREKCIAYSLFNQKLCQVNFNEKTFYSFFDVRFLYAPPVRFIALSNTPFQCVQNTKSIFEEKFYGVYNQKRIVIIPYDAQVAPLLKLNAWCKNN